MIREDSGSMAICEGPSGDDGFGATEHNMIRDLIFGIGILVVGAIMAMFMLPNVPDFTSWPEQGTGAKRRGVSRET